MQKFCEKCGEATITDCPRCGTSIRGFRSDTVRGDISSPQAYCQSCGRAFPWTEKQLLSAEELVSEDELLGADEKKQLAATFRDMTSENPRTTLAATRFKRLASKAGKGLAEALQKTLVDVLSETAKKIVTGV
jgi:hypothetical protein